MSNKKTAHEKTVRFELEKPTKNTIRFKEVLDSDLDVPVIGTLYVQKTALKMIEYDGISPITVTIAVAK